MAIKKKYLVVREITAPTMDNFGTISSVGSTPCTQKQAYTLLGKLNHHEWSNEFILDLTNVPAKLKEKFTFGILKNNGGLRVVGKNCKKKGKQ